MTSHGSEFTINYLNGSQSSSTIKANKEISRNIHYYLPQEITQGSPVVKKQKIQLLGRYIDDLFNETNSLRSFYIKSLPHSTTHTTLPDVRSRYPQRPFTTTHFESSLTNTIKKLKKGQKTGLPQLKIVYKDQSRQPSKK